MIIIPREGYENIYANYIDHYIHELDREDVLIVCGLNTQTFEQEVLAIKDNFKCMIFIALDLRFIHLHTNLINEADAVLHQGKSKLVGKGKYEKYSYLPEAMYDERFEKLILQKENALHIGFIGEYEEEARKFLIDDRGEMNEKVFVESPAFDFDTTNFIDVCSIQESSFLTSLFKFYLMLQSEQARRLQWIDNKISMCLTRYSLPILSDSYSNCRHYSEYIPRVKTYEDLCNVIKTYSNEDARMQTLFRLRQEAYNTKHRFKEVIEEVINELCTKK